MGMDSAQMRMIAEGFALEKSNRRRRAAADGSL
jgi:hypothetical protein